jgi:hypothetical protein
MKRPFLAKQRQTRFQHVRRPATAQLPNFTREQTSSGVLSCGGEWAVAAAIFAWFGLHGRLGPLSGGLPALRKRLSFGHLPRFVVDAEPSGLDG